ncbi:MAG: hypothetical protein QXW58_05115 [Thermosphaera sp.]
MKKTKVQHAKMNEALEGVERILRLLTDFRSSLRLYQARVRDALLQVGREGDE